MESDVIVDTSSHGEIKNPESASESGAGTTEAKEATASKQKAGTRTADAAGLEGVLCSPIKKLKSESSVSNILNEETKTP